MQQNTLASRSVQITFEVAYANNPNYSL